MSISPHGNVYSKVFWLQSVSDVLKYEYDIAAIYKGDEIVAGIGVFHKHNMMKIPTLTPRLSPILRVRDTKYRSKLYHENDELLKTLANFLKTHYKRVALSTISRIDNVRAFIWCGYTVEVKYTFINEIENISSDIFSHSTRKQIKKCEKGSVSVIDESNPEVFWQILKLTFEKKKHPLSIGKNEFIKLYEKINATDCCRMFFALLDDQPVSARIILYTHENDTVYDWVAGTDPDYFKTGVTSYLVYETMKYFSKRGFKYFDWNGANIESIARFKSNFGGTLIPYYYITWAKLPVRLMVNGRRLIIKRLRKFRLK